MVDRGARQSAAHLLRSFLTGEITSDELESDWPSSKQDKALDAVASVVWLHYDDFKPRRMVGIEAPGSEERDLLERYQAYLESEYDYDWPHSNFYRIKGLGALVPLTLGLLKPIDSWIKARNRKVDEEMDTYGDWDTWPFRNESEWSGTRLPPFIRS